MNFVSMKQLEKMGVDMSAPWIIYSRKLELIFAADTDVIVQYNNEGPMVRLLVEGTEKADALTQLLPTEVEFGRIVLKVEVVPANTLAGQNDIVLFRQAFDGNPIVEGIVSIGGISSNPFHYLICKKEVGQFWGDNLNNPHGITSILYEDLFREIFGEHPGIFFTTFTEKDGED